MNRHRPEVADVLRSHGEAFERIYGRSISSGQRQVLRDLPRCRTRALGGHRKKCDHCGHEQIAYNSCRNRHCPKCQAAARAQWLEARQHELLDVPYFHVVFTLPAVLGPLALQNKRSVYGALFRAAAETLRTLAADPKHLGAEIGFLAVLHTWGQTLQHHPHLHCVVPGGGVSLEGGHWIRGRQNFFLPVRVLSGLFRGKFLARMERLRERGELSFHGELKDLDERESWNAWRRQLRSVPWVVYAKPPFGGAEQVLKYLARYTHRVAISNRRLLRLADGKVTFRWKDYARGNRCRTMTLKATEFTRRFLLHVLPKGFVHIRHYGFLANRDRGKHLQQARELIGQTSQSSTESVPESKPSNPDHRDDERCPQCREGRLVIVAIVPIDSS